MDPLLVALLWLVSLISAAIFDAKNYKKTAWGLSFMTSILTIAFAFAIVSEHKTIYSIFNAIFRPEIAHSLLETTIILMLVVGIFGVVLCLYIGVRWLANKLRRQNSPSSDHAGTKKPPISYRKK